MTNVFLGSHGQASAGTDNYDKLSSIGMEQARLLGAFWSKSGFHVDAAFHGTLHRQQHTAELALENLGYGKKAEILEALNEYDHTTIDNLYANGLHSDSGDNLSFDQYAAIMARWRDAPPTDKAQSWQSFSTQGLSAIQATVDEHMKSPNTGTAKHTNLVFFTSGGIIATVLQQLLSLDFTTTMKALWQTRNASVTNLLFNKDGVSLVDYNTIAHLQYQPNNSLITLI